jgi:hypothetical protein
MAPPPPRLGLSTNTSDMRGSVLLQTNPLADGILVNVGAQCESVQLRDFSLVARPAHSLGVARREGHAAVLSDVFYPPSCIIMEKPLLEMESDNTPSKISVRPPSRRGRAGGRAREQYGRRQARASAHRELGGWRALPRLPGQVAPHPGDISLLRMPFPSQMLYITISVEGPAGKCVCFLFCVCAFLLLFFYVTPTSAAAARTQR